jgi:predicted peptidase
MMLEMSSTGDGRGQATLSNLQTDLEVLQVAEGSGTFLRPLLTLASVGILFLANCQSAGTSAPVVNPSNQSSQKESQLTDFSEKVFTAAGGERMRYLLFVPKDYDKKASYPLVLWLHGGGSRGDDPKQILAHGNQHGVGFLARSDNQAKYPAIIVAPQCPRNRVWGDPNQDQPTPEMKLVLEIIDRVQIDFNVDKRRLYVLGMSLGGYGTWDIIARRPGMFAAAVPICGGGDTSQASAMMKTAIWAFHGAEDELVRVSESRRMIAALKNAGANPKYTEYEGVGHNAWERAFAEPDLLQWMFAQQLNVRR